MSEAVSTTEEDKGGARRRGCRPEHHLFHRRHAGRLVYRGYEIGDLVEHQLSRKSLTCCGTAKLPNWSH